MSAYLDDAHGAGSANYSEAFFKQFKTDMADLDCDVNLGKTVASSHRRASHGTGKEAWDQRCGQLYQDHGGGGGEDGTRLAGVDDRAWVDVDGMTHRRRSGGSLPFLWMLWCQRTGTTAGAGSECLAPALGARRAKGEEHLCGVGGGVVHRLLRSVLGHACN